MHSDAQTPAWRDESRLTALVGSIATIAALLLAIAAPAAFYLLSWQAATRDIAMSARLYAAIASPQFGATDLPTTASRLLAIDPAPAERRLILDREGTLVARSGPDIAAPRIEQAATLLGPAGPIGEVRIARSLRPLLKTTALVALGAFALGLGIFASLRILPLRGLRRALAALKHEESKAREEAEEHLRVVFQNAVEAIIIFTPDGEISSCNPAVLDMFGIAPSSLRGVPITQLLRPFSADEGGAPFPIRHGETVAYRGNCEAFPVDMSVNETRLAGRPHLIAIIRDITERKLAEKRLSYMANYDSLTGLPNRSLFRDRLEQAMVRARRSGQQFALMFLDLDRFKNINDSLGHEVGDQLLKHVAGVLTSHLRETDSVSRLVVGADTEITVSRLGGDEFTVLIEGITAPEAVAHIAQRILDSIAMPFRINGDELYISTSIGVTLFPHEAADIDGLVKQADMAMYRAKELGRNTFFFYNDELNTEMAERHALEAALRHALERDEFSLHYQPKADLISGAITGVEALLRWNPTAHKAIGPDRFVPMLEDIGLILPVGAWVLQKACAQIAAWRRAGLPALGLAVNLSARQFRQLRLPDLIAAALADNGMRPEMLEVELTESMLMEDSEDSRQILSRLATMGIRLAIDDFGTGHSSLAYLKRFNVNTIKIDRTFVRDTPDDPEDSAITAAIIGLASRLNIRVVAEGVETTAQADFLKSQGCEEMQGYLLARPLPAAEFEAWFWDYLGMGSGE